jgi:cytochrome c-type biogenesis protein CcmH/NrfF
MLMRSLALAAIALFLATASAIAQSDGTDTDIAQRAHRLSREVMSPYCPGRTLADCPSPNAAVLREQIRDFMARGLDEASIMERLSARYGDAIVGVPRSATGWILPAALLIAGLAVLAAALWRLVTPTSAPSIEPDDELSSELDADLSSRGL